MKKNEVGFECRLCPSMAKYRNKMIAHLTEKHQEGLNSMEAEPNLSLDRIKENENQKSKSTSENKRPKIECEKCHELITDYVFPKHIASCKLYYKFMKETSNGFECG